MSGYVMTLGLNLVSWSAKKQTMVALSSCEAEFVALVEAIKELRWLTAVLSELGFDSLITHPLVLHSDNQAAIGLINSTKHHARTKHINRRLLFVRDDVSSGFIRLVYTPSEDQLADIFTKVTTGVVLRHIKHKLGIIKVVGDQISLVPH
jgi:hypothetical protein